MSTDYEQREYLSVSEVSAYTGLTVREIHRRARVGELATFKSAGGQYRFCLRDIKPCRKKRTRRTEDSSGVIMVNKTKQTIITGDARDMSVLPDNSVHLAITSPPYFNAKMYSTHTGDLGNVHDLQVWFSEIGKVWAEVYRVLAPGRKFFLNIMNLPIRVNKSFRTINLTGQSIDLCEQMGFVFKRDIVWHKTNGVRAHFGTYPWPGGILINNMHEFILEFQKPAKTAGKKYAHVTDIQRAASKLDKEFWLSIKNSDVWLLKPEKSGARREHSAPFPSDLPIRLIRAYSYAGETILDPFLGSGTTLAAAAQWERNGIGFEINADFCKIAMQRLEKILT